MGFDPNGAEPKAGVNGLYALVIYLPEPLRTFLDNLRVELVPGCNPHAHVSVLPPRPIPVAPDTAIEQARAIVAGFPRFDVELGQVEVFPVTDVVYISVEGGAAQLCAMHDSLNRSALAFAEPFSYHPHVTLAQELAPREVQAKRELATRRWREFWGPRKFHARGTVFVRNIEGNQWVDLAEGPLGAILTPLTR